MSKPMRLYDVSAARGLFGEPGPARLSVGSRSLAKAVRAACARLHVRRGVPVGVWMDGDYAGSFALGRGGRVRRVRGSVAAELVLLIPAGLLALWVGSVLLNAADKLRAVLSALGVG